MGDRKVWRWGPCAGGPGRSAERVRTAGREAAARMAKLMDAGAPAMEDAPGLPREELAKSPDQASPRRVLAERVAPCAGRADARRTTGRRLRSHSGPDHRRHAPARPLRHGHPARMRRIAAFGPPRTRRRDADRPLVAAPSTTGSARWASSSAAPKSGGAAGRPPSRPAQRCAPLPSRSPARARAPHRSGLTAAMSGSSPTRPKRRSAQNLR